MKKYFFKTGYLFCKIYDCWIFLFVNLDFRAPYLLKATHTSYKQ